MTMPNDHVAAHTQAVERAWDHAETAEAAIREKRLDEAGASLGLATAWATIASAIADRM